MYRRLALFERIAQERLALKYRAQELLRPRRLRAAPATAAPAAIATYAPWSPPVASTPVAAGAATSTSVGGWLRSPTVSPTAAHLSTVTVVPGIPAGAGVWCRAYGCVCGWCKFAFGKLSSSLKWLALTGAVAGAAAAATAHLNYAIWKPEEAALLAQLSLRLAQPVVDGNGRFIGVVPPASNPWAIGLEAVGSDLAELPDDCYRVLAALEDAHAQQWWRHAGGVDWPVLPVRLAAGSGASTLAMQLSSLVGGDKAKPPVPPSAVARGGIALVAFGNARRETQLARKSKELAMARSLNQHLGGHKGVATAYAGLAPYAIAGGEIKGLENAAATLFDREVKDLSRAQCALLVAMPKQPIVLGRGDRTDHAWKKVQARATKGLSHGFGADAALAIAEVAATPTPVVQQPATLAARTRRFVLPTLRSIRAEHSSASAALVGADEVNADIPTTQPEGLK